MNEHKALARLAPKWAKKIGIRQAIARLIAREVSVAAAEKLCTGRYPSIPREKFAEILAEEMLKDGFSLAGEKAS